MQTKRMRPMRWVLALIILIYLLIFMPLPYLVIQPGSAEDIRHMVQTKRDQQETAGALMLTTVRMSYPNANVAGYVSAMFNPYADVVTKKSVLQDESESEYSQRQQYYMTTSQSSAIQAAYQAAGIEYEIVETSVQVLRTVADMPAASVLEPGDQLIKLDNEEIHSVEEVLAYIKSKPIGSTISIHYERLGESKQTELQLVDLSAEGEAPRAGLGIYPVGLQMIQPVDERDQVEIHAGNIGGPSAGLMFALQIYAKLADSDVTKGYRIAGTGTITADGEVGVIGGVAYKVVAASRSGADLFFVPLDYTAPTGQTVPNASDALQRAEQMETTMKVVPVGTLQEAIDYLATLPPKQP